MKKLFLLALCSSLLIFATNSYSGSDEICCTWVNTNYTSGDPPQKLIFHFDGTFACYDTQKTSDALKRGTYSIDEKKIYLTGSDMGGNATVIDPLHLEASGTSMACPMASGSASSWTPRSSTSTAVTRRARRSSAMPTIRAGSRGMKGCRARPISIGMSSPVPASTWCSPLPRRAPSSRRTS